jgi:hypothetical protein
MVRKSEVKRTEEKKYVKEEVKDISMVRKSEEKKSEEKKSVNEEERDIFKAWANNYKVVSKMFEDSYSKLYRPWIESSGEVFEKAVELSKNAAPERYREFYDEWVQTYQKSFGKLYQIPTLESSKETLKTLLDSSEESVKIYKSWIAELEENSSKTRKILLGEPSPAKYKEVYEAWTQSYEKMFDELLTHPAMESMRELFEKYTGIPDIYMSTFVQMANQWKNSYAKMYKPWIESMQKLSDKTIEISQGDADPEAFKEFYTLWLNTYKETYDQYFQSMQPSKEVYDAFLQTTNIYLQKYKSWAEALRKMSDKTIELSKHTADPETYREFYNLWIKMYQKGIGIFFEDMPKVGPMEEMMEPVKIMARMYTDNLAEMSKMWVRWGVKYGENQL